MLPEDTFKGGIVDMRVGIMTWFYGHNYGAQLHSYALQQTVLGLGHECVMISFYPHNLAKKNILMNLNYKDRKKHPCLAMRCLMRNLNFYRNRNALFNQSQRVHTASEIDELKCDVIILGSDEVFKISHPYFDPLFYGVGIKTPCIAYAPSAGQTDTATVLPDSIKVALKKIRALSVRDFYTKELIQSNTGLNATVVLDPTLLYDFEGFSNEFPEKNYILVYSFDTLDEYRSRIQEYASEHALSIICVGRYCNWANNSYDSVGVKDWAGAFEKASVVVTDSFHGTIFAIKNRKPFIVVGRSDKLNKIDALLNDAGIVRPYYDGRISVEQYLSNMVDYMDVSKRLDTKKLESLSFLNGALSNVKRNL